MPLPRTARELGASGALARKGWGSDFAGGSNGSASLPGEGGACRRSDRATPAAKKVSAPLARSQIIADMGRYMASKLGIDAANEDEMAGAMAMAAAAVGFFSDSASGGPIGAGTILQWALYSALWKGKVSQEEIDEFFTSVDSDPARIFVAWRQLKADGSMSSPYTVALVPGNMGDGDIMATANALYQRQHKAPPTSKKRGREG
jgi:hypothetical protein